MEYLDYIRVVEINPTELCNLKCTFCPRAHGYPNQNLHMSVETAVEIRRQLEDINFSGKIALIGRGEPTLCKNIKEIVSVFSEGQPAWGLRLTTNGKKIDSLEEFFNTKKIFFTYDIYTTDVDEQNAIVEKYKDVTNVRTALKPDTGLAYNEVRKTGRKSSKVMEHRERLWHEGKYAGSGSLLGFTNRAGALGETSFDFPDKGCAKLVHQIYIDWNGNYNLCCDDWNPLVLGNIYEESIGKFISSNETLHHYRKSHFCENKREGLPACQTCNRVSPVIPEIKENIKQMIMMDELI